MFKIATKIHPHILDTHPQTSIGHFLQQFEYGCGPLSILFWKPKTKSIIQRFLVCDIMHDNIQYIYYIPEGSHLNNVWFVLS